MNLIYYGMVLRLWRSERASRAHITSPMSRCMEKTYESVYQLNYGRLELIKLTLYLAHSLRCHQLH